MADEIQANAKIIDDDWSSNMDGSSSSPSLSDFAALMGNNGLGGSSSAFVLILLFAMIFGWGGLGIGGNGNATADMQADMQRGFDQQNTLANQREILSATNQSFHDTLGALQDKYSELQRDIAALAVGQQQNQAAQQQCCCETKMLISQVASDQRYESAMQANATQQLINDKFAALEARDAQREIDALRMHIAEQDGRINAMQTQAEIRQATAGVVRYPDSFAYNAGANPFCGCNGGYPNM